MRVSWHEILLVHFETPTSGWKNIQNLEPVNVLYLRGKLVRLKTSQFHLLNKGHQGLPVCCIGVCIWTPLMTGWNLRLTSFSNPSKSWKRCALTHFHPYVEFGTDERMAEVLRDELVRPQALEYQDLVGGLIFFWYSDAWNINLFEPLPSRQTFHLQNFMFHWTNHP